MIEKGKHYSRKAVKKAFLSVRDDKTTFTGAVYRLKRDFNISPVKSTCHKWFHEVASKIDLKMEYEPWAVKSFSGALAIDEVYDGGRCTFFATDPVNNKTIAFHRSDSAKAGELIWFLKRLKKIGINPKVFISDAASIYDRTPEKIWSGIEYQLCRFHFMRECMKNFLDGIRRYRKHVKDPKDKKLLWKNRYIFVTRRENLTTKQKIILDNLSYKYPTIQKFRYLTYRLFNLFDCKDKSEAWEKRDHIVSVFKGLATINPHIERLLRRLKSKNFSKVITFMDYENLDSTTNHVERTNRWFRKRQKTHYRNRKEENIVNTLKADLMRQIEMHGDTPIQHLCKKEILEKAA
jgi:hypothetical protein